jgi:Ser/Thr protein kinase RdoA (MazF antagonist)
MLEQPEISHYLLSLGLVKPRDVVERGLTVVDASRRNAVFVAATADGSAYVVKQAVPTSVSTLAHEAAVLRVLAHAPGVAAHVPTVVLHDPAEARLVLRSPGAGRDWGEHHGTGRFPRMPVRALGRALGALHALPAGAVESPPPGSDAMWGLSLPEPPHALLLDLSAAALDVVARLQASRATCDRLAALRARVDATAVVHADLRWENCLAVPAPGARRRTRLLLVDWELAGPGAPGYDVGTVLAEYLRLWVGSIPIVEPGDPGRLLAQARHPLRHMQPAIEAFWTAYAAAAPPGRPALGAVVELAALRLLQTAVERAQGVSAPTAHVIALLQLADNLLRRPDEAALILMGLRE